MCFLSFLEKVAIARETARPPPQAGCASSCQSGKRKGCLPSGGPIQGMWPQNLKTRARKFPAGALGWPEEPVRPQGNGSLCCPERMRMPPRGHCEQAPSWDTGEQGPVPRDWPFGNCLLLGKGESLSGLTQDLYLTCLSQDSCLQGQMWGCLF